jgi:hypothetical protein
MPGYGWTLLSSTCTGPTTNATVEMVGNYYIDRKWDGAGCEGNDNITQEYGEELNVAIPWSRLAASPSKYYINDVYHESVGQFNNPWDQRQTWSEGELAVSNDTTTTTSTNNTHFAITTTIINKDNNDNNNNNNTNNGRNSRVGRTNNNNRDNDNAHGGNSNRDRDRGSWPYGWPKPGINDTEEEFEHRVRSDSSVFPFSVFPCYLPPSPCFFSAFFAVASALRCVQVHYHTMSASNHPSIDLSYFFPSLPMLFFVIHVMWLCCCWCCYRICWWSRQIGINSIIPNWFVLITTS